MAPSSIGIAPVVVVCDGSTLGQHAVAVATRQAARHSAPLVVVAAARPAAARPGASSWSVLSGAAEDPMTDPQAVAERAWWRANHTDPSVAIQIHTVAGSRSPRLTRLTAGARLLVLGDADLPVPGLTGPTTLSAALGRTFRAPVLQVGPSLRPSAGRRGVVVVGFGTLGDTALMPRARREAELRGQDMVVVRAVRSAERLEPALEESWQALRPFCGHVPCRIVHLVADPAAALVDQSGPGDLIVVGAPDSTPLDHLTHDPVVRETARRARCDLLVLPLGAHRPAPSPSPDDAAGLALHR